jgi:uncharacterized repeat protein (TIGR01451 family)
MKKKEKKVKTKFFRILTLMVIVSMTATAVSAQPSVTRVQRPVATASETASAAAPEVVKQAPQPKKAQPELVAVDSSDVEVVDMDEAALYIVLLQDAPLATYRGDLPGLRATSPKATGARKLDAKGPDSVAYLDYLASKQAAFTAKVEQTFGRPLDVRFHYDVVLNGMAVYLTPGEAAAVAEMPEVQHVERDFVRKITTDVSPQWIGAPGIWDGSTTGGLPGTMGEGIIVGDLDTGINMDHPSFAEVGPLDGYVHVNPLGDGNFLGLCATQPATYTCNNKLIGFYDYVNDGYLDQHSHGSHTASTAAGNWVTATMVFSTTSLDPEISGIAPHANIIAYDVCDFGGCPNAGSIAAVNQAVSDGVDVINFSIGGGPGNPWEDAEAQAFLAARTAGVFVATSAGNDGPGAATMGSPGNSPWMATVGNATHNRQYMNALVDLEAAWLPIARDLAPTKSFVGTDALRSGSAAARGDSAAPMGRAPQVNVFQDPSFEAGTPNPYWDEYSFLFGTPLCDLGCGLDIARTGAWYVWFGGVGVYEEGAVTQTVTITPAATSLSFWMMVGVCDSASDYMEVTVDGNQVFNYPCTMTTTNYIEQVVDVSAYADGGMHEVAFHAETFADNSDNSNFFVDDVTLDNLELDDIVGRGITGGYGPAPIVYAGDYPNPNDPGGDPAQCVEPYPAGTWTNGEIVVCDRGSGIGRVEKGINVSEGGASGFVLANLAEDGESVVADGHVLPAVHIGYSDGEALRAWLAAGDVHTATISGFWTDYDPANGDIMASSSSRGPNAPNTRAASVIKPDITAPGTSILAAYSDTPDLEDLGTAPGYPPGGHPFGPMGGTSMACPHVAGAAALLMALHPTWSPAEIQSALMATALSDTPLKEDAATPADPFDMGAGRVDLTVAGAAGLVLDITEQEYLDADPGEGGDPSTLNLASLGQEQCMRNCAWTREVSSTLSYGVTWTTSFTGPTGMTVTVTPASFTLMPFATQVISIEADVSGLPTDGSWAFGELMLTPEIMPVTTTIVYTDTNVGGPTWDRPAFLAPCLLWDADFSGGLVSYHEFSTTIGISSSLNISSEQDFDGFLHLYEGSFDDTDPCANVIALNGPGGVGTSEISTVTQTSGPYYFITSGRDPADQGDFTNTLTLVMTPSVPPDVHFPVAVLPSAGVLPDLVEVDTRRDAGSQLIEDLIAIEITDLTLMSYGLVTMDEETFSLYQVNDNTMDFPDIFFQGGPGIHTTELDVPAGSVRLLAEILDTTSPDLDMLVFLDTDDDGVAEQSDVVTENSCQSATGGSYESCDIMDPAAGRWFVMVINYTESASPPDSVTLGTAIVGADAGNMTLTGPPAIVQATPFDLRLFWDEADMAAGDAWYGAFSIGSDSSNPGDIGMIPVNVYRYDDDVTKYASAMMAYPGDTVTYTIEILGNVTPEDLTYWLTDTIPAGLTYVPGSAMASDGMVDVTGDTLTWSGTMAVPSMGYMVSDNTTDPSCDTGFIGYVNLEGFGIMPQAPLSGDGVSWTGFSSQNPIQFYGVDHVGMGGTDDGFAFFDDTTVAWPANTSLPDPADPNDIMAILWNDMEVVYDGTPGSVRGVSLATAGPEVSVMEYDDVEPAPAGSTMDRYDFEVVVYSTIDDTPGFPEMIFAYDNVVGSPISATVGVENVDGSLGSEYLYGDPAGVITDGLMICFDYQLLSNPVEITYQATVDAGTWEQVLTNDVWHDTDNPGSMADSTGVDVTVAAAAEPTWDKTVYVNDNEVGDIGNPIIVFPNDTIVIVDQVQVSFTQDISFDLLEEWDDSLELVGYELPPGSLAMPGIDVMTDTHSLTWMVSDMPADWSYVITKTFQALEGEWTVDLLTETLTIEYVAMQPDPVVLTFRHGGVNSPPVAVDDSYSTSLDTVLTVMAPGVLFNDTDAEFDQLMAMQDAGPGNGMVDLSTDGSFVYTPTTGFSGVDSFTYHAYDGMDNSNIATVWITVTAAPPCTEVTTVTLGVQAGTLYVGNAIAFSADIAPDSADKPYSYTVDYDDGTMPVTGSSSADPLALSHTYDSEGTFDVMISVWNCDMTVEEAISDTLQVEVEMAGYDIYLPLVAKNYGS